MENIIAEHFHQTETFKRFSLIFHPDPIFIKQDNTILLFNKLIFERGLYQNGERKLFSYYFDNVLEKEEIYRDVPSITWYSNGLKYSEMSYFDGQPEGPSITWYPNGNKMTEGSYLDGLRDGI